MPSVIPLLNYSSEQAYTSFCKIFKSWNCKADVGKNVLCFPVRPPIKSYFDKNFALNSNKILDGAIYILFIKIICDLFLVDDYQNVLQISQSDDGGIGNIHF